MVCSSIVTLCFIVTQITGVVADASHLEQFQAIIENINEWCMFLYDLDENLLTAKDLIVNAKWGSKLIK